jgi:hypothetical protein
VPSLLKLAQWFWSKRFLNEPTPILHFWDYLPFEKDLALYLNKLESPSLKYNLYQVWLNSACWFWRRRFFFKNQYTFTLSLLSPLREGYSPSFEQNWIPFTQGWFVLSLIEFGLLVFDKKILKNFQCIFTLSLLSPFGEGLFPTFEQTWIPFTQVYFVLSLIEFGLLILEKKILRIV